MLHIRTRQTSASNRLYRRLLLGLVAAAVIRLNVAAHAAGDPAAPVAPAVDGAQQSAAAAPTPDSIDQIQEITVTAQRRTQRLTDVPISISVASAAQLQDAGISDVASLPLVTPGLRMMRTGVYLQPSIRGVTAASSAPGAESGVALYLDGIYQPLQAANNLDLPDVDHIEILKGPQGTLFGRNSTGGAVQIFTRDPSYTAEGDLTVGYGRFNDQLVKGYMSAPLIDGRLAFSLSGLFEQTDGWVENLLDNGKDTGRVASHMLRAKFLLDPTDNLKLILSASYSHKLDDSLYLLSVLNGNTTGKDLGGPIATEPWTTSVNFPSKLDVQTWSTSLRAFLTLDSIGVFSTVTAFQSSQIQILADADGSPSELLSYVTFQPDKNYEQELNFSSNKFGPAQVVAGLFYYSDHTGFDPGSGANIAGSAPGTVHAAGFTIDSAATVRAYAAYTEINVDLTPNLVALAGIRDSYELRTVRYLPSGIAGALVGTQLHEKSWNAVTPRASLRYEIMPRTNVYVTYSEGFKSGIYDLNGFSTVPVNPEKVKSYEIGFKTGNSLFDANIAAYRMNTSNLQVQYNNGVLSSLQNAGSSRTDGVEADGMVRIARNFSLNAGVAWTHARYVNYSPASLLVPVTNAEGVPIGGNVINPNADLSGTQIPNAPKWTVSASANYEQEFPLGTLGASGDVYHSADVLLDVSGVNQPAYTLLGARVWYQLPRSKLKFSLWGKNLRNEAVIQATNITADDFGVSYAPPRTYGGTVEYGF